MVSFLNSNIIRYVLEYNGYRERKIQKIVNHYISEPEYPSANSLKKVLNKFNIEIAFAKVQIHEITNNYLVVAENIHKQSVLIDKHKNKVYNPLTGQSSPYLQHDFESEILGMVFPRPKFHITKERVIFFLVVLTLLLCFILLPLLNCVFISLLMIGLFITNRIEKAIHGKDLSRHFACKEECKKTLEYDLLPVLKPIKVHEVAGIIFIGLITVLMLTNFEEAMLTITLIVLSSLIFTFYTLYIQLKQKRFCQLCLILTLIIWTLTLLTILYVEVRELSNGLNIFVFFLLYELLAFLLLREMVMRKQFISELSIYELESLSFRKNKRIFQSVFLQSPEIYMFKGNFPQRFTYFHGADNNSLRLTLFTNPLCKYCQKLHENLLSYINESEEPFIIEIVFSVPEDFNDQRYVLAKNLIYQSIKTEQSLFDILSLYWNQRVHEPISQTIQHPDLSQILTELNQWQVMNGLRQTPSVFINDRPLLNIYRPWDVTNFISDLNLHFHQKLNYSNG